MATDPQLSRFALSGAPTVAEEASWMTAYSELLRQQTQALEAIHAITRETEQRISNQLDSLRQDRQATFANALKMIAELERLGIVDLAPVSPILGPSLPGDGQGRMTG